MQFQQVWDGPPLFVSVARGLCNPDTFALTLSVLIFAFVTLILCSEFGGKIAVFGASIRCTSIDQTKEYIMLYCHVNMETSDSQTCILYLYLLYNVYYSVNISLNGLKLFAPLLIIDIFSNEYGSMTDN